MGFLPAVVLLALLVLTVVLLAEGSIGRARAATLSGEVEVWEDIGGQLTRVEDRGDAVIFVAGFDEPFDPRRKAELFQNNKQFSQRVLVVTRGQTVSFPNRDSIHHNVWSRSPAAPFDLGLYKAPEMRGLSFDRPGIVTVFCNIHPQMIATILVLPNQKFAVTGADGRFQIEGIPAGEFPVYAWVEGAQPIKQTVRFAANATVALSFRLTLHRISVRHLDKDGKPYKSYGN